MAAWHERDDWVTAVHQSAGVCPHKPAQEAGATIGPTISIETSSPPSDNKTPRHLARTSTPQATQSDWGSLNSAEGG